MTQMSINRGWVDSKTWCIYTWNITWPSKGSKRGFLLQQKCLNFLLSQRSQTQKAIFDELIYMKCPEWAKSETKASR